MTSKKKEKALTPEIIGKKGEKIQERKALSPQQIRFCEEYIVDLNATKAAVRAGYAKKSSRQTASRLMTDDNISHFISELIKKRSESTKISAERVLQELASLGFSNIKQVASWDESGQMTVVPSSEVSDAVASAIESIKMTKVTVSTKYDEDEEATEEVINTTLTVKMHKKLPAILMIMKHLGMLDSGEGEQNPILKKALENIQRGRN